MIGSIYYITIHLDDDGWGKYHLMPLQEFKAFKYRGCDRAVRCLILETGKHYELYVDSLETDGVKVA